MSAPGRRTLDTRGSLCPQPILDLAAAIGRMAAGEELDVLSDDPAFPLDARAWCAGTGHELLELRQEGRLYTARVRRDARR
jgi:TusA-related sulfurtransferase